MALQSIQLSATNDIRPSDPRFRKYRRFNQETERVVSSYWAQLPRIATKGPRYAELIAREHGTIKPDQRIHEVGLGIVEVLCEVDFERYWKLTVHQRCKVILSTLHEGLLLLGQQEGWPLAPLRKAHDAVVERDFEYDGWWAKGRKKGFISPTHELAAKVYWRFEMHRIDLFAVFFRKRLEVGRKRLGRVRAHVRWLNKALGDGHWSKRGEFVLVSRDGKNKWKCKAPQITQ
jgi:hypothetical protein